MSEHFAGLTIEVNGNDVGHGPDCGFTLCFSAHPSHYDCRDFDDWRMAVTHAVFGAAADMFGKGQDKAIATLIEKIEQAEAKFPDYKIRTSPNGVPAIQIESVHGEKIEVNYDGKTATTQIVSAPAKTLKTKFIVASGNGGIESAERKAFAFRVAPTVPLNKLKRQ